MKSENIEVLSEMKNEITSKNKNFTGVVRGTRSRYGFLSVSNHEDIFIKPQEMDRVFSGDTVEVTVNNYGTDSQNVVINSILKSDKTIFMGLFSEDETGAYVQPDDYGFNRKIRIPKSFKRKARNNQYVKIEVIEHPFKSKKPKAKIIEIVGDKNCWHIQADYNLSKFNVASYVREDISQRCSELASSIDLTGNNFRNKRKDLTKIDFFTIDGENTVDIDDAIYVQKLKNKWKLLVAISDVSEVLEENTEIDNDAYNRMSTVYLVGKTIPMLSNEITDVLSLKPNTRRLVVVADITLNLDGSIDKYSFYEALIESKAKLSYNEVDSFIETGTLELDHMKIKEPLSQLKELQELLRDSRVRDNILPPNREDYRNILDFNRKIENIEPMSTNKSHKMVEEAMLCANRCASDFVSSNYDTAIYKTQDGILDNKVTAIYHFLNDYIDFEKDLLSTPDGFKSIMNAIEEHESSEYLKSVVNLYLKDSEFSMNAEHHTSMGFDSYTYFTSPIRRYSDILIHRMIKAKIRKKKYTVQKDNYIEHFKNKLDNINRCVKETEKWMQTDYLNRLDKSVVFKAKIIGVSSSALSIKILNNGIEGTVLLSKMLKSGEKAFLSKLTVTFGDNVYKILDEVNVSISKTITEDNSVMFQIV